MMISAARIKRTGLLLAAELAILAPVSSALAAAKTNTFRLSGQESGTLSLNTSETCTAGNIESSDGVTTVRLYLTDHGVKPTGALWFLLIEARKAGKITYPAASPNEVSLGASSGASNAAEWTAEASKKDSGTLVLGAGFKSGSIDLTLPPSSDPQKEAKSAERISGSWSCG